MICIRAGYISSFRTLTVGMFFVVMSAWDDDIETIAFWDKTHTLGIRSTRLKQFIAPLYIGSQACINFEKLPTFISVPAYSNSFVFEVARHAVSRMQNFCIYSRELFTALYVIVECQPAFLIALRFCFRRISQHMARYSWYACAMSVLGY